MMDNEYSVDVDEIKHVIKTADVMLIRFPLFDKRLLLDARSSGDEGPMMKVVPRAGSAAERFQHLKQLRPEFPLPKNIVTFTWPKYVNSLLELGIWQAVVQRWFESGYAEKEQECEDAFTQLLTEERTEIVKAVTGEGYDTLWERNPKPEATPEIDPESETA